MLSYLEQLVLISSESMCGNQNVQFSQGSGVNGHCIQELHDLLRIRNGFYAFESALHMFPSRCYPQTMDMELWNDMRTWKSEYEEVLEDILFFAEDVFGEQFGIRDDEIIRFSPETCDIVRFSGSLEGWAEKILNDYDFETGYGLASQWQKLHGAIPFGYRLLPKTPFFLGGKFEVDNLYLIDSVEAMKFRAEMWRQSKDLPDGTEVELRVVE